MQAGKRNHVLPFTVYSHHTGCLHCAPTLNISHALVSLNTVNVFIRQNRTFRKSPSVLYIYIFYFIFFLPHPQRSQLRISMCLLAPGRAPLVCVSETWPSVWYHVTEHWQAANQCCSTANTPLSTTRLGGVLCVPHFANCEYDCESVNRLSKQSKTEFRRRGGEPEETVATGVPPVEEQRQCCDEISLGQSWFAAFKVRDATHSCTVRYCAS